MHLYKITMLLLSTQEHMQGCKTCHVWHVMCITYASHVHHMCIMCITLCITGVSHGKHMHMHICITGQHKSITCIAYLAWFLTYITIQSFPTGGTCAGIGRHKIVTRPGILAWAAATRVDHYRNKK